MLLICPVRPGDNNEELRYALRSWQALLALPTPLSLMTVGYRPWWLDPDLHVEGNRYDSAPLAVFDNVLLASIEAIRHVGDTGFALYMNDDFFCLDPVGSVLPVKRDCSLAEHIARFPAGSSLWWPVSLRLTASWLAEEGFPDPDSYEVHRPLLARPGGMAQALTRWVDHAGGQIGDIVPQWRTCYGVLNKVDAFSVRDAKLSNRQTGVGTPWISTSDQTWRRHAPAIRKRFQKPSRWEKA